MKVSAKRLFDIVLSCVLILALCVPAMTLALAVKITSAGSVFYWSDRVGVRNVLFRMPKFRSMRIEAPVVATHLLNNPKAFLTPIGEFLRKSSLDELPQLWSILKGDMSFVGPRPALFNQHDLMGARFGAGVDGLGSGEWAG
jgi:O-antigen biosynthesis protein WbqP